MRFLKTITTMIVACCLCVSICFAYTEPKDTTNIEISTEQSNCDVTVRTLDEFYAHYREITGNEWSGERPTQTTRGAIIYRVVSATKDIGAGRIVEIGCMVEIGVGQSSSWNRVYGEEYCEAVSSGNFTWSNLVTPKATMSTTKKYIDFVGRGVATVTTTSSTDAGLQAAGFSLSGSSGSTFYFRKTASVNATVYQ